MQQKDENGRYLSLVNIATRICPLNYLQKQELEFKKKEVNIVKYEEASRDGAVSCGRTMRAGLVWGRVKTWSNKCDSPTSVWTKTDPCQKHGSFQTGKTSIKPKVKKHCLQRRGVVMRVWRIGICFTQQLGSCGQNTSFPLISLTSDGKYRRFGL